MGSLRDRLGLNRKTPQPAKPQQQPDQQPPAGGKGPPQTYVRFEAVTAACGHAEPFGLFADGQDKFREDRRKKSTGRPCKACREKAEQEFRQQAAARRAAKGRPHQLKGRLPHASSFHVVYDAGTQRWTGTLTVTVNGEPRVIEGSASGVFKLLTLLDDQYRELTGEMGKAAGAP